MGERRPQYSYDRECERLAHHFLDEEIAAGRAKPADIMGLAQALQDAVDAYFGGLPAYFVIL